MNILVLNGPNLNLLGTRRTVRLWPPQPCPISRPKRGPVAWSQSRVDVAFAQSNSEGALVDHLHAARGAMDGVVLNAGAYTHTSVALRDAISAIALSVVELHLSNTHARETFRHVSMIAPVCVGVIQGFGAAGYPLALTALHGHLTGGRA